DLRTGRLKGSVRITGRPMAAAFATGSRPEIVGYPDNDRIHILTENTHNTCAVPGGLQATACTVTADGLRIAYSASSDLREASMMIRVAPLGRLTDSTEFRTGTHVEKMVFDPTSAYLVSIGRRQFTVWDLNRRESRTAGNLDNSRAITYAGDGT